jgi:hypothetical protein
MSDQQNSSRPLRNHTWSDTSMCVRACHILLRVKWMLCESHYL